MSFRRKSIERNRRREIAEKRAMIGKRLVDADTCAAQQLVLIEQWFRDLRPKFQQQLGEL
jgi:hypothetical protein